MNYHLKQHGGVPRGLDVQADTHANGVQLGQAQISRADFSWTHVILIRIYTRDNGSKVRAVERPLNLNHSY